MAAAIVVAAAILTKTINLPMNEALGALQIPESLAEAEAIWTNCAPTWQACNITRTVICGMALMAVGYALTRLTAM